MPLRPHLPSLARRRRCALSVLGAALLALPAGFAQRPPDPLAANDVQAVVVLARHGVRAPIESEIRGSRYNAQPWPAFPVAPGVLTPHGAAALAELGRFYARRYAAVLSPDRCRAVYAQANTTQRTLASANAILSGLAPHCHLPVTVLPHGASNPLFSPAEPGVPPADLFAAIDGRVGDQPAWFTHSFASPLRLLSGILRACAPAAPCTPPAEDLLHPAPLPSTGPADLTLTPPAIGADLAEHFLLEYTEGLPMRSVGWGQVDRATLDTLMESNTRFHDFMLRTPLYAQTAASDLALRIARTVVSQASGQPLPGSLGAPSQHFVLLDGHDSNLTWLGGLLQLDWLLGDEARNATPPGGALAFELLRPHGTAEPSVRVVLIAQTLDQIRDLIPLDTADPPFVVPVYLPGCSTSAPGYPCPLSAFRRVLEHAADPRFLEPSLRPPAP